MAACGRVIPILDRSIFAFWIDVTRFPFGSAVIISFTVGSLYVHGHFDPVQFPGAPKSAVYFFVAVLRTNTALFIKGVFSLFLILLLKSHYVLFL